MGTGDQYCSVCGVCFCVSPVCAWLRTFQESVERTVSMMPKRDGKPLSQPLPDPFEGPFEASDDRDNDPVNSPSHYTSGGIETIDAIEAWGLDRDFCLANAVKYISRAGKKDPSKLLEDLRKARWYLDRRIKKLEEAR